VSVEANRRVVLATIEELFNLNRMNRISALIHPEFVNHGAGEHRHGREGFLATATWLRTAFPDLHLEVEDVIAQGDRVAVRATFRGTHLGELEDVPPTGRAVVVEQIHILRIADGMVVEHWGSRDDLTLLRQLGARGDAEEADERDEPHGPSVREVILTVLRDAEEPVREAVLYDRALDRGADIEADGFLCVLEELVTVGRVRLSVDHDTPAKDSPPFGPRFYRPVR
jgi:predicted ester cyclase